MKAWVTIDALCLVAGAYLLAVALRIARDPAHPRRWGSAAFWALLALALGLGAWLPPMLVGTAVVLMALLAATGQLTSRCGPGSATAPAAPASTRGEGSTRPFGLLLPLLLVPAIAIAGGFTLHRVQLGGVPIVDSKQVTMVALGLGCFAGLALALHWTREKPMTAVVEGGRLLQLIGWTLLLPQVLAALGGIFTKAGVGDVVAQAVSAALPVHHRFVAVVVYCAAMALLTMAIGNAFAAFPIVTVGIGIPFIVRAHGGDPAIMAVLGMLSGYCGTLVTPMAANFNLVPVRLLELPDDDAVIRAQAPFAAAIWIFNVALMAACVYPRP
jgi:uncharacterized membrane protein